MALALLTLSTLNAHSQYQYKRILPAADMSKKIFSSSKSQNTFFTSLIVRASDMDEVLLRPIEQQSQAPHVDVSTLPQTQPITQSQKSFYLFFDYLFYKLDKKMEKTDPFGYYYMDIVLEALKAFGSVSLVKSPLIANLIFVFPYNKDGQYYHGEYQNKTVIGLSGENYVYDPELVSLSLSSPHIDHENYLRMPFYLFRFKDEISPSFKRPQSLMTKHSDFCGFMTSHGRTMGFCRGINDGVIARDSLFQNLSNYKQVKSGGKHLNNIGGIIPYDKTREWFSQFKFIICYENQSFDGYITEKVFNAYYAGAIPIYYADRSVLKDINPKAIIFGPDFESEDALIEYIKKVDQNQTLYQSIWNEPLMLNPYYSYEAYQERLKMKIEQLILPKI